MTIDEDAKIGAGHGSQEKVCLLQLILLTEGALPTLPKGAYDYEKQPQSDHAKTYEQLSS
jgi:hypothetical protein